MNEVVALVLTIVFGLTCFGILAAAVVAILRWSAREQQRWKEALAATGFEPVTRLSPDLARRLLELSLYDAETHQAICRHVRREQGYTVLLQGIEAKDEALAEWQLGPAVHAPDLGIPRLTLVPQSLVGDRVAKWTTRIVEWRSNGILRTVPFAEDPVFERLFEVLGADESAVRACLNETRRACLSRMEGLTLTGEGDLFTFERYVRSFSSKRDETWLRLQVEDARALLGILWTDRAVDRGAGA